MHVSDRDIYTTANLLLLQHGQQEAWRIATVRALDLHLAEDAAGRDIWERIVAALKDLTISAPEGDGRTH